ncbi:MAG TPA: methyltransferase domain-containing protein [Terracidiphilus sp.]|nr:methyltransferase domain-containing protein [Terracidiphilus sp.]
MGIRTPPSTFDETIVPLLCDPDTRYPLEAAEGNLRNALLGRVYPVRDGIPLFVSSVRRGDFLRQFVYDRVAPAYDLSNRMFRWLFQRRDQRPEFMSELELQPGSRVLEVAVGTGRNLRAMPEEVEMFGVDMSWGMLRRCRRNLQRWGRRAHLFQGEAERLPFVGNVFDCVFSAGSMNAIEKKSRAIREMLWVAKPGAKIVIVDEAWPAAREADLKSDSAYDRETEAMDIGCPLEDVPPQVEDLHVRTISDGDLYCMSFRKPRTGGQIIAPAPARDLQ